LCHADCAQRGPAHLDKEHSRQSPRIQVLAESGRECVWREWRRGRGTPCVRALDAREFAAAPVDTGDVGAAQHVQGAAAGVHAT